MNINQIVKFFRIIFEILIVVLTIIDFIFGLNSVGNSIVYNKFNSNFLVIWITSLIFIPYLLLIFESNYLRKIFLDPTRKDKLSLLKIIALTYVLEWVTIFYAYLVLQIIEIRIFFILFIFMLIYSERLSLVFFRQFHDYVFSHDSYQHKRGNKEDGIFSKFLIFIFAIGLIIAYVLIFVLVISLISFETGKLFMNPNINSFYFIFLGVAVTLVLNEFANSFLLSIISELEKSN